MTVSGEFSGEHAFLSNFWPARVALPRGLVARSVEYGFQWYKTADVTWGARVLAAATPGEAKRLGHQVPLRPDWDAVRLDVMRWLLTRKFAVDSQLAGWLLATGDALLVEGNTWGDRYWGACGGVGENWLGHLLVARRAELRVSALKFNHG